MLLALVAGADLLAVCADNNQYVVLDDLLSASHLDLKHADFFYSVAGLLQILGTLATAVAFIVWFERVRANADYFAQDVCTLGKGWAIGGWFVPFANLWLPYRVASEVWKASAQAASTDGAWREVSRRPVNVWWGLVVVSLLADRIASTLGKRADTVDALQQSIVAVAVSDLLNLAAAIFAILFVRKLTAMQEPQPAPEPVDRHVLAGEQP
ncbi:DUF4328 domain-containing protein [Streptomyces sp. NPDC001262]|uniref:DUF4328 domain-containing protein n=1 Tax=Streptomyces sp. NPDC001262 TaxID=3364552 RepID=UPI003695F434